MVLLANGGVDVPRAGGLGGESGAPTGVVAMVRGRGLRTRYNRHIRRATVVVGQRSLSASAGRAHLLLLLLEQRIRLKLRLVPSGSSIPLHHQFRLDFEHLRTEFDEF